MKIVNDLRPLMLDRMAEDGYSRRRQDDLARAVAQGPVSAAPIRASAARGNRGSLGHSRRRWSLLAGATALVAAAAAAVVVTAGQPASRQQTPPSAATAPDARTVLLASAAIAARAPVGSYWYIRERDWEGSGTLTKRMFGATYASTEESWTGAARSRTTVNEHVEFSFASAADKARWQAAGRPKLVTAAGTSTRPATSNYHMRTHFSFGEDPLTWSDVQALPANPAELGKKLRRIWDGTRDKAGLVGFPHPSYGQFLVGMAGNLLAGPVAPGTKAAMYRLLARQPGIAITHGITDPLGRSGVAIADGGGDTLVLDPHTGSLLDSTTNPVHADARMPAASGVTVYEAAGWVKQLGVPAGS